MLTIRFCVIFSANDDEDDASMKSFIDGSESDEMEMDFDTDVAPLVAASRPDKKKESSRRIMSESDSDHENVEDG